MKHRAAPAPALAVVLTLGLSVPGLSQAPGASPDFARAALLIDTVRQNECAMTEEQAEQALPELGFDPAETGFYVEVLFEGGMVSLSDDMRTLMLSDALCAGDPAQDEARFADAFATYDAGEAPPSPGIDEDALLALVRDELGEGFMRGMMPIHVEAQGCSLDLSDREAAVSGLVDFATLNVALMLNAPLPLPEAVDAELRALAGAAIDEPGDAFERSEDRLTLIDCSMETE